MSNHEFIPVQDTTTHVIVPLSWVNEVNAFMFAARAAEMRPDHPGLLQAKADDNRANAAERFPKLRQLNGYGIWYDEDGDDVMFTPHGYRKVKDVQAELSGD